MTQTMDIERDERAPMVARELLGGLPGGRFRRDDADLLVTELVSNAVRHGAGERIRLVLGRTAADGLRCEVIDDGEGFLPLTRPIDDRDTSGGWGLYLVETLSDTWGVREGSTHVWFELGPAD